MTGGIRRIRAGDLTEGPLTPGMRRREAVATERMWAGLVHTEPGAFSGWHHHGDRGSVIYVADGRMRIEFGTNGEDGFDALSGDFVYVPPHTVHREGNTTDRIATVVVARDGAGESVFNVDGPAGLISRRDDERAR